MQRCAETISTRGRGRCGWRVTAWLNKRRNTSRRPRSGFSECGAETRYRGRLCGQARVGASGGRHRGGVGSERPHFGTDIGGLRGGGRSGRPGPGRHPGHQLSHERRVHGRIVAHTRVHEGLRDGTHQIMAAHILSGSSPNTGHATSTAGGALHCVQAARLSSPNDSVSVPQPSLRALASPSLLSPYRA